MRRGWLRVETVGVRIKTDNTEHFLLLTVHHVEERAQTDDSQAVSGKFKLSNGRDEAENPPPCG